MSAIIRVTAEESVLGERGVIDITDNCVLVTAGFCVQANIIKHENGPHIITVTGATGTAMQVQ